MPIHVVMRGTVIDAAVSLEPVLGVPLAALQFGDVETSVVGGSATHSPELERCEVILRDLAAENAAQFKPGDPIIVVGALRIRSAVDAFDDRDLSLVHVEALAIGIDLAR